MTAHQTKATWFAKWLFSCPYAGLRFTHAWRGSTEAVLKSVAYASSVFSMLCAASHRIAFSIEPNGSSAPMAHARRKMLMADINRLRMMAWVPVALWHWWPARPAVIRRRPSSAMPAWRLFRHGRYRRRVAPPLRRWSCAAPTRGAWRSAKRIQQPGRALQRRPPEPNRRTEPAPSRRADARRDGHVQFCAGLPLPAPACDNERLCRPRESGGIGRRPGFRFQCRKAWGFESLHPHQIFTAGRAADRLIWEKSRRDGQWSGPLCA